MKLDQIEAISNQQSAISKFGWLLAAGCWLLSQATALACPLCKEALFDPGQAEATSRLAKGYTVSIATLLSIPLVLVGGIAIRVVRASRRANRL